MTATTECQRPRRSKGFTIDSIIGTDTSRNSDDRPESPDTKGNFSKSANARTTNVHRHDRNSELEHESLLRQRERTPERTSVDHERLRPTDVRTGVPSLNHVHRNSSSVPRDIRDINFSSANNIREGIRAPTSPDTLKHFHEAFMHSASGSPSAGAGVGVGMAALGHMDAQRHCRHPLSSLAMPGYPPHLPTPPQMHPMLMNRDLRQMYPYIADRYPGYFLPRYGMGSVPGLFFQPYRKPKRIRTAFSPSQLLQLEKSFEKSHYVVGQERKDLASELQLSETQVKVWFQNRRTKYKRTKSEQDGGTSHDETYPESPEESDISDNDDIDDVGDNSSYAHAYQNPIQTC